MLQVNKKLMYPIRNTYNFKLINNQPINTIEHNNTYYDYNENKSFSQLKNIKHCIFDKTCKTIIDCASSIYELNDHSILIQMAKETSEESSCDERKIKLNGNFLINFYNCTLTIDK